MEDDRNVHQARRGPASVPATLTLLGAAAALVPFGSRVGGTGVPRHGARRQRRRQDRGPAHGDRVAVADGDRDALRHRRRQPGQGGRPGLRLPAAACRAPSSTATTPTWRRSPPTSPTWCVASDEATSVDTQLRALGIPVVSLPPAADLSQEYAQFARARPAHRARGAARAEVAHDQAPDRADRGVGPPAAAPPRPTTTSSTRRTTRRPRARSSGRCWACSACTASPTPPRAPPPTAGTRN